MNIRNCDLNLLVVLEALLRKRNVSHAAAEIGLSQPAMSNALSRLRETFGDPLFIRGRTSMIPTERALELEQGLKEALEKIKGVLEKPRAFNPKESDMQFTLGATDYSEFCTLPKITETLEREAPSLQIRIVPLSKSSPLQELSQGTMDFAIGLFDPPPNGFFHNSLSSDSFVCLLKKGHSAAKGGINLKTFASLKHVLVAPWEGMVGIVDRELEKKGMKRAIALSIPHFLLAPHIVAETDYAVTLPEKVAAPFEKLLPVKTHELPLKIPGPTLSLLWHKRSHESPAQKWLRDLFVRVA